jgi:hypothetical protein
LPFSINITLLRSYEPISPFSELASIIWKRAYQGAFLLFQCVSERRISLINPISLDAERLHRIDLCGPSRRDVAGDERYEDQSKRDNTERYRIGWLDLVKLA